jgi:hypothetical protein
MLADVQAFGMPLNWQALVAAVGIVVAILLSFFQLRNTVFHPKTMLRADLEILKLLPENHELYPVVKASIERQLQQVYRGITHEEMKRQTFWWLRFAIYTGSTVVFTAWTIYVCSDGFSLWSLLTGYFAVGAAYNLLVLFSRNRNEELDFLAMIFRDSPYPNKE